MFDMVTIVVVGRTFYPSLGIASRRFFLGRFFGPTICYSSPPTFGSNSTAGEVMENEQFLKELKFGIGDGSQL